MTDKYTLEEIEAAIRTKTELLEPVGIGMNHFTRTILDELTRPKPEFAEGQVINTGTGDGNWSYVRYESSLMDLHGKERTLTLAEHGPAVKALRDAMEQCQNEMVGDRNKYLHELIKSALTTFDADVGDDDE